MLVRCYAGGGRQEGVGVSEVLCRGEEGRTGWVLVRCYAGGRKAGRGGS